MEIGGFLGLCMDFCFHIHKSVIFSHPSLKYTFVSKFFFIQIILLQQKNK